VLGGDLDDGPLPRRCEPPQQRAQSRAQQLADEHARLATELAGVADRLERLGAGPQVQAECERLRRLARSAAR
jgi:hypothetical protein